MVNGKYILDCTSNGKEAVSRIEKVLKDNKFKKIYASPENTYKFKGKNGGRILFFDGLTVEAYKKKNLDSIVFIHKYSNDSPTLFTPKRNIKINKIEIETVPQSQEITDLIQSIIFADSIDEGNAIKEDIIFKGQDGKRYSFK